MAWPLRKTAKFHNKKTTANNGIRCDSVLEAEVCNYLFLLEKAKKISNLEHQYTVTLHPFKIKWKVDFSYINLENNEREYAEAKGVETERYRMIKHLWEEIGPGKLFVYKGDYRPSGMRLNITQTIVPTILAVNKCPSCNQPKLW